MCPAVPSVSGGVSSRMGCCPSWWLAESRDDLSRRHAHRVVIVRIEQQPFSSIIVRGRAHGVAPAREHRRTSREPPRQLGGGAAAMGRPRRGPSSSSSGSAPPPTFASARLDRRRDTAGLQRGAQARGAARELVLARVSIASTGISRARALGIAVEPQRRLERGERELVDAQRPRERVLARAAADRLARPTSRPACGPPSSLSPEKHTSARPRDRAAHRRLVGERASVARRGCPSRRRR